MKRLATAAMLALFVGTVGCTSPRTELIVVVDTDLSVPDALDRIVFEIVGPEGQMATAAADPAAGLPAYLGVVHTEGALSPVEVRVTGRIGGSDIVERRARTAFQQDRTLVLTMNLLGSCAGAMSVCSAVETCAESGCRPVDVDDGELSEWNGSAPVHMDGGVPTDGAMDAPMGSPEVCNGEDDDLDMMVDEDFDLSTDRENCGSCGNACTDPTPVCEAGMCAIGACGGSLVDCDMDATNGCEADTTSDDANCGSCGNACGMGTSCMAGTCACPSPFGLGSSGCTDLSRDPLNCGSSGNVCAGGQACIGGSCVCRPGLTDAGGTCVNLLTDVANCGAVGNACSGSQNCRDGSCAPSCGSADICDRGCVDLDIDVLNCGACATACASNELCEAGSCVPYTLEYTCDRCPCAGCATGGCRRYPDAGQIVCTPG